MKSKKGNEVNIDDINPIEVDSKGGVDQKVFIGLQCALDSVQRHLLAVTKMIIDSGKNPIQEVGKNPAVLIKGAELRFGYKVFGAGSALMVRDKINPETPNYITSVATALTETSMGIGFEISSLRKPLEAMGKDISSVKSFANTAKVAFLPFMCRNYICWLAFNSSEPDLTKKAFYGGCAGLISAPLDSIGNKSMVISDSSKPIIDTYLQALKELKFQDVAKSAPIRFIAVACSATILSKEVKQNIAEIINPLFQKAEIDNNKSQNPSSTIASSGKSEKKLVKQVMEENFR